MLILPILPEVLVPGFGRLVLLCLVKMPRARGMAAYTLEIVTEHFANLNFSVVVAKCWFLGFVVRDRGRMHRSS